VLRLLRQQRPPTQLPPMRRGGAGDWLCLKNCHLVVGWLAALEKEVHALQRHPDFRLFLTSEANPKFPPSLLEACLKVRRPLPRPLLLLLRPCTHALGGGGLGAGA
jgi:hypothetical protein